MMIRYKCPACAASLQAPDTDAGKKVFCPKCKQKLQIPVNKAILAPREDEDWSLPVDTSLVIGEAVVPAPAPRVQVPQPMAEAKPQDSRPGATLVPGWLYARDGKRGGPVPFNQLQKFAVAGKLLPTDYVLQPGGAEWKEAGTLPGLFGKNPLVTATQAVRPPVAVPASSPTHPTPETAHKGLPRPLVLALVFGGFGAFLLLGLVVALICFNPGPPPPPKVGHVENSGGITNPPPPPPLSPRQKKIIAATDRGVAYLRKRLNEGGPFYSDGNPDGSAHTGAVALLGLTLLECDVSPNDPNVKKAAQQVRQRVPFLRHTYSIALAILFLDRLHSDPKGKPDPEDLRLVKTLSLRLIGSQNSKAGWDYDCRILGEWEEQNLLAALEEGRYQAGDFHQNSRPYGRDDNSIGQFVTLALWASQKQKLPVRLPLLAVENRYRERQKGDGSWSYNDFNPHLRDTSTCAALIGLAVGRGVRDDKKGGVKDLLKDEMVVRGLGHLGSVVGTKHRVSAEDRARKQAYTAKMEQLMAAEERTNDPAELQRLEMQIRAMDKAANLRGMYFDGDNWGDLYFLWSLERMAVIYDLNKIGEVDWHEWGTDLILEHQQADGSWSERFPGVPDTCFALLFLRRANLVKDLTNKLRGLGATIPPAVQPRRRD
jgi:hypothetical protein